MKLSKHCVKNQSARCGLFIMFSYLSLLVELPKRACKSGQCISANDKVKKDGAPT